MVEKDKASGLPKKYVKGLSKEDKKKQIKSIKEGKDRPKLKSGKTQRSSHVERFEKRYGKKITDKQWISKNLLKMEGINKILDRGMAAYYSSGSRPNVSKFQWANARLASVLTGGAARKSDKDIYDKYKI